MCVALETVISDASGDRRRSRIPEPRVGQRRAKQMEIRAGGLQRETAPLWISTEPSFEGSAVPQKKGQRVSLRVAFGSQISREDPVLNPVCVAASTVVCAYMLPLVFKIHTRYKYRYGDEMRKWLF